MSWYRFEAQRGILALVRTRPSAKTVAIALYGTESLKVRVAAPAVDGRANEDPYDIRRNASGRPNHG